MDVNLTPQQFWDQSVQLAKKAGAKYPEVVAAQLSLESGFGKFTSGKNNYLGLKGPGNNVITKEFYDGQWVEIRDGFIDFPSLAACIQYLVDRWYKDYKRFTGVNNANNCYAAARMLKDQGYATDPGYSVKLTKLIKQYAFNTSTAMIGPSKRPQDFGFKQGDSHLVVNDAIETMKAYNFQGKILWEIPCLARGQVNDFEWKITNSDTPPGLYKIGQIYKDYERVGSNPAYDRTLMSYGWYSFDLVELENQEAKYGRAGIMIHGGGSACGWPGAWSSSQTLFSTFGCVRLKNIDLCDKILPLTKQGAVFVSVFQEN